MDRKGEDTIFFGGVNGFLQTNSTQNLFYAGIVVAFF
jgi:hypothetical protein